MTASRHEFKIQSFDVDAFGQLSAARLLGYVIESSIRSAEQLGFGIEQLKAEQLTWVIGRTKIVLDEPLVVKDEIEVETWPSGLLRSAVLRDFRLHRQGRVIGRGTSVWFVLDLESRLPCRPHAVIPPHLHEAQEHEVELSRAIEGFCVQPELERRFTVRYSDIDLNEHVTAATYVSWAVEAVTETHWQTLRLHVLDVQFLEECHLGEEIVTSSVATSPLCRQHRITRCADGRELARLTTTWVEREPR